MSHTRELFSKITEDDNWSQEKGGLETKLFFQMVLLPLTQQIEELFHTTAQKFNSQIPEESDPWNSNSNVIQNQTRVIDTIAAQKFLLIHDKLHDILTKKPQTFEEFEQRVKAMLHESAQDLRQYIDGFLVENAQIHHSEPMTEECGYSELSGEKKLNEDISLLIKTNKRDQTKQQSEISMNQSKSLDQEESIDATLSKMETQINQTRTYEENPPKYIRCKWIKKDETQCKRKAKEEGFCTQHIKKCRKETEEYSDQLYQHSLEMQTQYNSWAEKNGFKIRYKVVDSRHMTPEELVNEIKVAKELCQNIKI